MISQDEFVREIIRVARQRGYKIESMARTGRPQIDFGHKKLHSGHLAGIYPDAIDQFANISSLIERVAPGRPCSHRPMKEILQILRDEGKLK